MRNVFFDFGNRFFDFGEGRGRQDPEKVLQEIGEGFLWEEEVRRTTDDITGREKSLALLTLITH